MFSVVKMMKEQGNQFDWSQIAIDIPSLPCFKPEAEWPWEAVHMTLERILVEGYAEVDGFIVRVTGENPSVSVDGDFPVFVDCEPVVISERKLTELSSFDGIMANENLPLTPIRSIRLSSSGDVSDLFETLGVPEQPSVGSNVTATSYYEFETNVVKTVVYVLSAGGGGGGAE